MADYSFQNTILGKAWDAFEDYKKVLIAASCAAGKTRMAIDFCQDWVTHRNSQILIFAHGQTLLRKQFTESFEELGLGDMVAEVTSFSQIDDIDKPILIMIPQAFNFVSDESRAKFMAKVGLVIVDEAHHFYHSPLLQKLLKFCGKTAKELLLTGSPSKFIRENQVSKNIKYFPIFFSTSEMVPYGIITDPDIVLTASAYNFKRGDLSKDMELKQDVVLRKKDTAATLDILLHSLGRKVLDNHEATWKEISTKLGKTMIAAHSISHANDIVSILTKNKIKTVISTSDNDPNGTNIEQFTKDDSIVVLVVVGRGRLGFNFPKLQNIIDITGSLNPDSIFQLMNRVTRRYEKMKKLFLKVMPEELIDDSELYMNFTVSLIIPEVFQNYNGNHRQIKKLLRDDAKGSSRTREKLEKVDSGTTIKDQGGNIPNFSLMKQAFEGTAPGIFSNEFVTNIGHTLKTWGQKRYSYKYKTVEEALEACRKLGINSHQEYLWYHTRDPMLPGKPSLYYDNWSISDINPPENAIMDEFDWLYNSVEMVYRSCKALGITDRDTYLKRYLSDPRLPYDPESVYKSFLFEALRG